MFTDLAFRLRALFRRKNVEAELDAELRAHLENEIAKHVAAGVPRSEAARRASLALGGLEQIKEECRESLGLRLWDELRRKAGSARAFIPISIRANRNLLQRLLVAASGSRNSR